MSEAVNHNQEYFEAQHRYQGRRDAAFHIAWESWSPLTPGVDLKILPIDWDALHFAATIWPLLGSNGIYTFNWQRILEQFRSRPRRLDVAMWDGPVLCGLAAGMASKGPDNVTIRFLERGPWQGNPLRGKIAPITFDIADSYAKVIEKQNVRIKNPAPGAIPYYETLGFSLAEPIKGSTYWSKVVE